MSKVKKAIILSTIGELTAKSISFISVIAFSRLLLPSELGVYAIASSIVMMASEFRLLGTNSYIIREREITTEKLASCLTLAVLISWSFGILLLVSSEKISNFYSIPELKYLLYLLCISFFLSPFTSTTTAFLARNFKYKPILTLQILGNASGLILAIVLLTLDYGIYSLAISQASTAIIEIIIARAIKPKEMSWSLRRSGLREIASVGIFTSLVNLLSRFEFSISDIILGKIKDPTIVALTSRAIGLQLFIRETLANGIAGVAMPFLAQASRDNNSKFAYLNATNLLSSFLIPPLVVAAFCSHSLIVTLFGENWSDSAETAALLSIWMILKTLTYFSSPLLISLNKQKFLFVIKFNLFIILSALIFFIAKSTEINIAYALIMYSIIEFIAISLYLKKTIGLDFIELFISLRKSLLLTTIIGISALLIKLVATDISESPILLVLYAVTMCPIWLVTVRLIDHPIYNHVKSMPFLNRYLK